MAGKLNMPRHCCRITGIEEELTFTYNPPQAIRIMSNDRDATRHRFNKHVSKRFLPGKMQKDVRGSVERGHALRSKRQTREPARQQACSKGINGLSQGTVTGDYKVRVGNLADSVDSDFNAL